MTSNGLLRCHLWLPLIGRPCAFCACWPALAPAILFPFKERFTWGKTRLYLKECRPPGLGLGLNWREHLSPITIVCPLCLENNNKPCTTPNAWYCVQSATARDHHFVLACIRSLSYTSTCTDSAFTMNIFDNFRNL